MGKALLACERYSNDRIIASVVTAQDMETYHVLPRHLDGIVNQLRVTRGVEAAIFLYESGSHSYKVSARSNGRVDVAAIAVKFGGGGHKSGRIFHSGNAGGNNENHSFRDRKAIIGKRIWTALLMYTKKQAIRHLT